MRLLFIDITREFHLNTPLETPLGGLQSAICYLARELAAAGHRVTVANGVSEPVTEDGVHFIPWQRYPLQGGPDLDAVIPTLVPPELMKLWHAAFRDNYNAPLWLLWCHHDADQPGIAHLREPEFQAMLDGVIAVSEWQARRYRDTFGIGWDKLMVMRNAVSPAFLEQFEPGQLILPAKCGDPLLIYTSTPFRGLELLLDAVPLIRTRIANTRFKVFSSLEVYGIGAEDDINRALYERCTATGGVEYVGGVGQRRLAEELKGAWCLAYPNIFPETSCISVMEAFAAGCKVITTHNGALPETAAGLATMIINPGSREDHVARFAEAAVDLILKFPANVFTTERELQAAVAHARGNCAWKDRVPQLTEWIAARLACRRGERR